MAILALQLKTVWFTLTHHARPLYNVTCHVTGPESPCEKLREKILQCFNQSSSLINYIYTEEENGQTRRKSRQLRTDLKTYTWCCYGKKDLCKMVWMHLVATAQHIGLYMCNLGIAILDPIPQDKGTVSLKPKAFVLTKFTTSAQMASEGTGFCRHCSLGLAQCCLCVLELFATCMRSMSIDGHSDHTTPSRSTSTKSFDCRDLILT